MFYIDALDLYNVLKEYSEEELKNLKIVIDKRKYKNVMGDSCYATKVEQYNGHIRIVGF